MTSEAIHRSITSSASPEVPSRDQVPRTYPGRLATSKRSVLDFCKVSGAGSRRGEQTMDKVEVHSRRKRFASRVPGMQSGRLLVAYALFAGVASSQQLTLEVKDYAT